MNNTTREDQKKKVLFVQHVHVIFPYPFSEQKLLLKVANFAFYDVLQLLFDSKSLLVVPNANTDHYIYI